MNLRQDAPSAPDDRKPRGAHVAAFVLLFLAYQSPEGLGQRLFALPWLHAMGMLAFLPLAYAIARLVLRRGFDAYALERPFRPALLLATIAAGIAAKALALGVLAFVGAIRVTHVHAAAAIAPAIAFAWFSTFFPSIAEDIVTRGFLFRVRAWTAPGPFIVASTCLYVLNHVYVLGLGPWVWLRLACFGLAYAAALHRTKTLWASVGLHWGWNAASASIDATVDTEILSQHAQVLASSAVHVAVFVAIVVWPRERSATG